MEVDRAYGEQERYVHAQPAFVAGGAQVERAAARDHVLENGLEREGGFAGEARDEPPDLGAVAAQEAFRGLGAPPGLGRDQPLQVTVGN